MSGARGQGAIAPHRVRRHRREASRSTPLEAALQGNVAGDVVACHCERGAPAAAARRSRPAAATTRAGIALRRLSLDWRLPPFPPRSPRREPSMSSSSERGSRSTGRANRRARSASLHTVSCAASVTTALERWDALRIDALRPRIEREFMTLGFTAKKRARQPRWSRRALRRRSPIRRVDGCSMPLTPKQEAKSR